MARKAFYSFHYKPDSHRASQVRNIGAIEGNQNVSDNKWEEITKGGDKAIKDWIADQMTGKSCVVVLIGSETARRKWIDHEIKTGWDAGKGLVGIYIHHLKNLSGQQSTKGANPFDGFTVGDDKKPLNAIVKAYNPHHTVSTDAYKYIADNLEDWVEEAIKIRNAY